MAGKKKSRRLHPLNWLLAGALIEWELTFFVLAGAFGAAAFGALLGHLALIVAVPAGVALGMAATRVPAAAVNSTFAALVVGLQSAVSFSNSDGLPGFWPEEPARTPQMVYAGGPQAGPVGPHIGGAAIPSAGPAAAVPAKLLRAENARREAAAALHEAGYFDAATLHSRDELVARLRLAEAYREACEEVLATCREAGRGYDPDKLLETSLGHLASTRQAEAAQATRMVEALDLLGQHWGDWQPEGTGVRFDDWRAQIAYDALTEEMRAMGTRQLNLQGLSE